MKKIYAYKMAFGLALFGVGMCVIPFLEDFDPLVSFTLISSGVIIVAFTAYRHMKYKDAPEGDERTKKLGAYGITYSWLATLLFVAGLYWTNYFGILDLTVQQTTGSMFFVMIITAIAFQRFFFWKGDAE